MGEPWKVHELSEARCQDEGYEAEVTQKGANSAYPEEDTVIADFYEAKYARQAAEAVNLLPELVAVLDRFMRLDLPYPALALRAQLVRERVPEWAGDRILMGA